MPETFVMPNPYSPYADADPLYRHMFPVFARELVGDPTPGSLVLTVCERMTVVPTEPITYTEEHEGPLPEGLCPLCLAGHRGEALPRFPTSTCQRCESSTHHNGLCALCRQEQHANWWQASDSWARPFRVVLPGSRVLDGAVFPNGHAMVIDDPEQGLSSSAASLELLLTGYHRAEVMLAEDVIRVGTARVHHAASEYARMAIDLADTRRDLDRAQASIERARAAVLREAADYVDNDDDCDCGGCDTCIPRTLAAGLRDMADEAQPDGHVYLSTGCLHDDHTYCKSMTGLNGQKRPGECKHCGAKCVCRCHQTTADEQQDGAAS